MNARLRLTIFWYKPLSFFCENYAWKVIVSIRTTWFTWYSRKGCSSSFLPVTVKWCILEQKSSFNPLSTNSPNWSLCISFKNKLRGFDKRSRQFPLGDHFINSHLILISWHCMDIVRRKLTLDTIGTKRVKWFTVNLNIRKGFSCHKPLKLLTYKTFDFVFSKNTELKFSIFLYLTLLS